MRLGLPGVHIFIQFRNLKSWRSIQFPTLGVTAWCCGQKIGGSQTRNKLGIVCRYLLSTNIAPGFINVWVRFLTDSKTANTLTCSRPGSPENNTLPPYPNVIRMSRIFLGLLISYELLLPMRIHRNKI